jgi:hypothetical protein
VRSNSAITNWTIEKLRENVNFLSHEYCQHAARIEAEISAQKAITGEVGIIWRYKRKFRWNQSLGQTNPAIHCSEIKSASDSNRA